MNAIYYVSATVRILFPAQSVAIEIPYIFPIVDLTLTTKLAYV